MNIRVSGAVVALALTVSATTPIGAHHTVAAVYDATKTVMLSGLVTQVDWQFPHIIFHLDVRNADGVHHWDVETVNPQGMRRHGLTEDFVKAGDRVSMESCSPRTVRARRPGDDHDIHRDDLSFDGPTLDARFLTGRLRNRHCPRRPHQAAPAKRHNCGLLRRGAHWFECCTAHAHAFVRQTRYTTSMADDTLTPPAPSPLKSAGAACKRLALGLSLSRFHTVVGTLAGIASIAGAGFSLVQFVRPANTGDLVTIVQAAGSRQSLADATIEVLTTQNAIVATRTPDSDRPRHAAADGGCLRRAGQPSGLCG